ncbi:AzlC family ABC transporter permease [Arachnia propionica]|uniref:Azaleucine resistance protein AzlC n=2 Tax=Arachnia propionica TaxID=1750 RepID=A0A448N2V3_9ACTN|nr:AzlC family ABC transporter permease [Arachnia propionica]AFN47214.1 AzlC protein [Arachnia propionica F0230a]VEH71737.1 azaleucine resistance protein AzlC [Arachnia propionica]
MTAETSATWRMALSVSVATGAYGVSFGALAVAAGLDVWQAMVLSLLMYTGGSQFAFVGALAGGGLPATGAAMLVGLRNAVYVMQVNSWFHPLWAQRILMAHFTTDESTAVAAAQPDQRLRRLGFWVTGAGVFALWNAMTLVGALLGNLLGDPKAWGLDGAALAAFCGLLWPRLVARDAVATAIAAAAVTVVLVPVFPAGLPILAAVVVGGGATLLQRRRTARRDQSSRDEGAR